MTHAPKLLTISAALIASITLVACNNRAVESTGRTAERSVPVTGADKKDADDSTKSTAANAGTTVADAAITTKINAALVADDQLKALNINVDTRGGKVVLTGSAPDAVSLQRATTLAKSVEGVIEVDNRLAVQPKG